jgi:hypothetical protein
MIKRTLGAATASPEVTSGLKSESVRPIPRSVPWIATPSAWVSCFFNLDFLRANQQHRSAETSP